MLVRKWMSPDPLTLKPEDPISRAVQIMVEKQIHHIPILAGDRLVGIVSDRDLKEFSPSKASTLDVYEMHYLLSQATLADAMKRNPISVGPDDPVERAASIMRDSHIGCLPVTDEEGTLVGILTQEDVFKALVNVTGCHHGTIRMQMTTPDTDDCVQAVTNRVRKHGLNLLSVLSTFQDVAEGKRQLVVRVEGEPEEMEGLERELEGTYPDLLVHRWC